MQIQEKIVKIINGKLKNPIYKTLQILNIKTILSQSSFTKKDGASAFMVVMHFVYMLVMNKKISTFRNQSDDSFSKDVYYRLLSNSSYNWRKLLSLSSVKILKLLNKVQDKRTVRVLIIDDTVEDKVGKNIEGSCDYIWSNKEKRKIRGINVVSLNYSDGFSNFMLDFAIITNKYARVKLEDFKNIIDYRSNAHKRRLETLKGKSQTAIDMVKRAVKSGIYADYLLVDSWHPEGISSLRSGHILNLYLLKR